MTKPKQYNRFYFAFLFFAATQPTFTLQSIQTTDDTTKIDSSRLKTEKGLMVFDYEVIPIAKNQSIDLLGVHYFAKWNDWLYVGFGLHAPMVRGDYGGFMTFDSTIHVQRNIFEHLFVDGGVSLGGGGGGSSVKQSVELSGTGGFGKGYLGVGREFDTFSAGVNYTYFEFIDSSIKSSQWNVFVQKPFSYTIGSYIDSTKMIELPYAFLEGSENILTLETNTIFQIDPKGSKTQTIHALSLQFSHFFTNAHYLFFGADIGYKGLPLYNQALHGIGYRYEFSPRTHLRIQIGLGSGGYSPDDIDTGSGLLVYPKILLEYLSEENLGWSFGGGYLVAPLGTSKNYTVGTALNYHLSVKQSSTKESARLKGFRFNLFAQTEFDAHVNSKKHHDIKMLSVQLDKLLNENWYLATQVSVAYNDFLGYPGYGEVAVGFGMQNKYVPSSRFQNFLQLLIGANVYGILFKPSIGTNYTIQDNIALYGQIGKTMSIDQMDLYRKDKNLRAYFIGFGFTYRFSLL